MTDLPSLEIRWPNVSLIQKSRWLEHPGSLIKPIYKDLSTLNIVFTQICYEVLFPSQNWNYILEQVFEDIQEQSTN